MVDETNLQPPDGDRAEAASLRQALGEVRREAQQEVARINRQLHERAAVEVGAASAAEQLALRQELDSLQRTLGAKEQALDAITEECRRLEDVLEDQHLVFDGLRKEVERRDLSLTAAQEEVSRLRQALLDLQAQASEPVLLEPGPPRGPFAEPHRIGRHAVGVRLWPLLLIPALTVLILFVWLRADRPPATATPETASSRSPAMQTGTGGSDLPPGSESTAEPVAPSIITVPTQRDRLRNGGLGPTLARLPGGRFRMGRNLTVASDFGPEREVEIAPFLMGVYEVTFEDYDRFARATGRGLARDFGWGRGNRPVVGVSWEDARAYATWLSRETGRSYRLPSEAEWEYAARAGGRGSYWWGFGLEPNRAVCLDCGSAWDNRSTAPVGSFEASPFGLHDTAGNVMEWVADCYESGYDGAPSDGSARTDGPCTYRVARGGAFNRPSASMRTYVRARFVPGTRLDMLGFRVARDI
ncbi:SUMF1/EgtB/PvdO family nonheme iron enzyme [Thiocapsa roseopersicina]|uniref:Formylglycine-generating enzyme, required for sulfatase activity, contains SUMF1/FGE domain n=1 Tax=Thiocapsa roseopersicina TaxID=1058 RepID=A0A1H3C6L5_THIRO|nr:SUMF1/EgtB/PvdO family nonheme iron enzyme [Thiocapsa roseopersicina]SDX49274.1 Formylglycine-generating enzyme, required for sulfatase activity, contains SUMF1/FGE domain [Thiocapsa roseopersicina]